MMLMFLESVTISETAFIGGLTAILGASAGANIAQWRTLLKCQEDRTTERGELVLALTKSSESQDRLAAAFHELIEAAFSSSEVA